MSLIQRLFDRIGIDEDDQFLLMEDEKICNVSDLVLKGATVGSPMTNLKHANAIEYLANAKYGSFDDNPERVLERLWNIKQWCRDSWEMFLFKKLNITSDDTFADDNVSLVSGLGNTPLRNNSQLLEKGDGDEDNDALNSSINVDTFKVTPDQIQMIKKRIEHTNWEYDGERGVVKLNSVDTSEDPLSVPIRVFVPLYPHQMKGIEKLRYNYEKGLHSLLLRDEMGLGTFGS